MDQDLLQGSYTVMDLQYLGWQVVFPFQVSFSFVRVHSCSQFKDIYIGFHIISISSQNHCRWLIF
jgi:hypothetical protein